MHVLGPPTLEQSKEILKETARDPDEFWHLMARAAIPTAKAQVDAHEALVSEAGRSREPTTAVHPVADTDSSTR